MPSDLVPSQSVVLEDHCTLLVQVRQGTPLHLCPSSLPADTAGCIQRLNAQGSSTVEMDRDGSLLFLLKDFLIYPREQLDEESGEVHKFGWLVLIDPNGERWGTSSGVVAGKLGQLLAMRSAKLIPWPLAIQIVTRKARRSGRSYHDLVVLAQQGESRGPSDSVDHASPARSVDRPRAPRKVSPARPAGD